MFDNIDPKYDPQRNVKDNGWAHDERYHVPRRLDQDGTLREGFKNMARDLQALVHAEELEEARRVAPFVYYIERLP